MSGGWTSGVDLDDCWIFNLNIRTWTEVRHWHVVRSGVSYIYMRGNDAGSMLGIGIHCYSVLFMMS